MGLEQGDGDRLFPDTGSPQQNWSDALRDMRRRDLECPRLLKLETDTWLIWGALTQRLGSGGRATLLEPTRSPTCSPRASKATTGPGQAHGLRTSRLRAGSGQRLSGSGRCSPGGAATSFLRGGVGGSPGVRDWDRMITFYDFPKDHWESPSHDEPGRGTLRGPQASDRCCQALQEGPSVDSGGSGKG